MKLYLVRHGMAALDNVDQRRELNQYGRQEVTAVANALAALNIHVDFIFHSGLVRAEQTAEMIAQALQFSGTMEAHTALHPMDMPAQIASEVTQSDADILIVSHMPFLGRLVGKLVAGNEQIEITSFETATVVCLERIAQQHWSINWVIQPAMVMALMPQGDKNAFSEPR